MQIKSISNIGGVAFQACCQSDFTMLLNFIRWKVETWCHDMLRCFCFLDIYEGNGEQGFKKNHIVFSCNAPLYLQVLNYPDHWLWDVSIFLITCLHHLQLKWRLVVLSQAARSSFSFYMLSYRFVEEGFVPDKQSLNLVIYWVGSHCSSHWFYCRCTTRE